MQRGTGVALAVVGLLAGGACGAADQNETSVPKEPGVAGLPLVSDEWEIVEMATAHGAFTVEVEIARDVDTAALARQLVEPLQERYAEVLVYFYDRADDATLPLVRVQWTASDGYRETRY